MARESERKVVARDVIANVAIESRDQVVDLGIRRGDIFERSFVHDLRRPDERCLFPRQDEKDAPVA